MLCDSRVKTAAPPTWVHGDLDVALGIWFVEHQLATVRSRVPTEGVSCLLARSVYIPLTYKTVAFRIIIVKL